MQLLRSVRERAKVKGWGSLETVGKPTTIAPEEHARQKIGD